jgi:hypothetical protein
MYLCAQRINAKDEMRLAEVAPAHNLVQWLRSKARYM